MPAVTGKPGFGSVRMKEVCPFAGADGGVLTQPFPPFGIGSKKGTLPPEREHEDFRPENNAQTVPE